jgi:hypothetical protein
MNLINMLFQLPILHIMTFKNYFVEDDDVVACDHHKTIATTTIIADVEASKKSSSLGQPCTSTSVKQGVGNN